jgi:putative acetyltransferase
MKCLVRSETPADHAAVAKIHSLAFESDSEAVLVEKLRRQADPPISLVAEVDGEVVGHVLFTAVAIGDAPAGPATLGLAPLAVHPEHQDQGVGTALVESGLNACLASGCEVVVTLGHPDFYGRFGFGLAVEEGLSYGGPQYDPFFMVKEIRAGTLATYQGEVKYHPLIDEL